MVSNKQTIISTEEKNNKKQDIKGNNINIINNKKDEEDIKIKTIETDIHDNKVSENENKTEELLLKYENMKNKVIIFIKLMQKYSQVFTNITENISSLEKTKIENIGFEYKIKNELKKTVKQFNKLLFNPKLSENFFESPTEFINNNIEFLEQDNYLLSSDNNLNENEKEVVLKVEETNKQSRHK